MSFTRRLAMSAVIPLTLVLRATDARACAVPSSVRVENQGTALVQSLHVSEPSAAVGPNRLLPPGLAPGDAFTITLPSCMGMYEVTAVFADGRTTVSRVNATTIRGLALR